MTSVLLARAPEVRYPNGGEDLYLIDLVNMWPNKELGLRQLAHFGQ